MVEEQYRIETVEDSDGSHTTYEYLFPEEAALKSFFYEMFQQHWGDMVFGPCLEGAVFEIQLTEPPSSAIWTVT